MQQKVIANVLHQQASKKFNDREEEVRRNRVPLTKAIPARDPALGDFI
jgi:hypothetical protein